MTDRSKAVVACGIFAATDLVIALLKPTASTVICSAVCCIMFGLVIERNQRRP